MSDTGQDHYAVLGVPADASPELIKAAYRGLLTKVHPDRGGSEEECTRVNLAYQVLSNPLDRAQFDRSRPTPGPAQAPRATASPGFAPPRPQQAPPRPQQAPPRTSPRPSGPTPSAAPTPRPAAEAAAPSPATGDDQRVYLTRPVSVLPRMLAVLAAGWVAIVVVGTRRGWGDSLALGEILRLAGVAALLSIAVGIAVRVAWGAFAGRGIELAPGRGGRSVWIVLAAAAAGIFAAWQTRIAELTVPQMVMATVAAPGGAAGALAHFTFARQRLVSRIVSTKTARDATWLSSLPGTPEAEVLERVIAPHLGTLPGLRVVRNPSPGGLYSHLLIRGQKVAVVRAVGCAPGQLQWSGAALMVSSPGSIFPSVLLDPSVAAATALLRDALSVDGHEVLPLLVVLPVAAGQFGMPDQAPIPRVVLSPDAPALITEWLADGLPLVDQEYLAYAASTVIR